MKNDEDDNVQVVFCLVVVSPVREKRQELPKLIERVLGEKPGREELDAFLTFFDITATGILDSMEFGNGQGGDVSSPPHTQRVKVTHHV